MTRTAPTLTALALLPLLLPAPAQAFEDYASARAALVAAYQAGDHEAALGHARAALSFRPGSPPLLSSVALLQAHLDRPGAALETLLDMADAGVIMDVSGRPEFEPVRTLDGYARLEEQQAALREPRGTYRVAARLDRPDFVPEGIARDPEGNWYLGSIRHAGITRITGAGPETFVADGAHGLGSVFGLRVDADAGLLWVSTAVVAQGAGHDPERLGRSGILRFRLEDGALVDSFWLPADGAEHVLGDLILEGDDRAVTTDSLAGAVLELDTGDGEFRTLIEPGRLTSPQGIVFDEARGVYFIADWGGGLFRFHRPSGGLERVAAPPGTMVYGIDGLYLHDGDLVAVQNLAQPHRVTRIRLDAEGRRVTGQETLARSLPEFDEPTLGTIQGDSFYLNANSHWNRFDTDNRLPDADTLSGPLILEIPLR